MHEHMIKHINYRLITIDYMLIKSAKPQAMFGFTQATSWYLVGNKALCNISYFITIILGQTVRTSALCVLFS